MNSRVIGSRERSLSDVINEKQSVEFGTPGTATEFLAEDYLPKQSQGGAVKPLPPKAEINKVITNVTEEISPVSITTKISETKSAPQEYYDADPALDGFERMDNLSGPVPYRHLPEFKNGIWIRPLNPIDAAKIHRASRSQSLTSLFDALNSTVNIPYRYLTIADHIQIMYWHMLNSFSREPFDIRWPSMYRPESVLSTLRSSTVVENKLEMTEAEFDELRAKGLDIPRVMALDMADTVSEMQIPKEGNTVAEKVAYKTAVEEKEDLMFLVRYMQYVDFTNLHVRKSIALHKDSAIPRIKGLSEYLKGHKNLKILEEINALMKRMEEMSYGMEESFEASAPDMQAKDAVKYLATYLDNNPYTEKPARQEILRLESLLEKDIDATFTPLKERTTLTRTPWTMFSFLQ